MNGQPGPAVLLLVLLLMAVANNSERGQVQLMNGMVELHVLHLMDFMSDLAVKSVLVRQNT